MRQHFSFIGQSIRHNSNKLSGKLLRVIDRYPFRAFLTLVGVTVALIAVGSILRAPAPSETAVDQPPKPVAMHSIGSVPVITVTGKVEHSGSLRVMAQSAGIVQRVVVKPGDTITKGSAMAWLSTTPAGASAPTLSRKIADASAQLAEENLPLQLELIAQRRQIAERQDIQADELRTLSDQSLADTRTLITMNEDVYRLLDAQVKQLEMDPAAASSSAMIQAKQARAGVLSGLQSLRTGLRTAEYQSSDSSSPAQLSTLSKELTLKQLMLEERAAKMNAEISQLNARLAAISESLMYPSAPCSGVIERVFVLPGQMVSPGQQVAALSCDQGSASVIGMVAPSIARSVSQLESSRLRINNSWIELTPTHISDHPIAGGLHAMTFHIPEHLTSLVTQGDSIEMQIPLGAAASTAAVPHIPIDAVYQSERAAYIYVAAPQASGVFEVTMQEITLGELHGSFVEVLSELPNQPVILDRSVMAGDLVTLR